MNIDQLIDGILKREGGYVNNPNDKGGPTRYGITEQVARMHHYIGDMSVFPEASAREIYRESYYVGPGFDKVAVIAPRVAEELTDTGVNMGPPVAATFLQRVLNVMNNQARSYVDVTVDGHLGPASLQALSALVKARGEDLILKALNCLQGARYIELAEGRPQNETFIVGWLSERVKL